MTKLFYTDPLKAAWMCREFGVKLQYWHKGKGIIYSDHVKRFGEGFRDIFEGWYNSLSDIFGGGMYLNCDRFYIHPDSLPIFEPREGDKDEDGHVYSKDDKYWSRRNLEFREVRLLSSTTKRDNKAFFTPEAEA